VAQVHASALSGTQISDLVAGATLAIDTPLGTKLPVRYARDGRLSGEAGGLVSYLGAASDKGRWWVTSDQLCHKWNRWFGSEPQCIRLSREGRVIHWRSQDGYAGTATISVPPVVQAEVAPPRADEPDRAGHAAPPGMPPEPAPASGNRPAPPAAAAIEASPEPARPANGPAGQPVPAMAPPLKSPPAPVPATAALPEQRPEQRPEYSPEYRPEPGRAAQPGFRVVNVRADDVLNVRSGPSADFDIVGGLPPGSRGIAITSPCRSAWCPVQHRSTTGWVNSAFLAPEGRTSRVPRYSGPDSLGETVAPAGLRRYSDRDVSRRQRPTRSN
jgi:hypothetical protein